MKLKQLGKMILIALTFSPAIVLVMWDDHVDPPFIGNNIYRFFEAKLFPFLTIIFSVIAFVYAYKKYNHCFDFKSKVKNYIKSKGVFRTTMGAIATPFLIYLWIWGSINVSAKWWTYNVSNTYWEQSFTLLNVGKCNSDYSSQCSTLTVLNLSSYQTQHFRWYSDKPTLLTLKNKEIQLIGVQSPLGYIVNEIYW
jgi:hypothetical protein